MMDVPISDLLGAFLALIGALVVAIQSVLVRKKTVTGSVEKLIGMVILINFILWTPLSLILYFPSFNVTLIGFTAFILSGIFGFFLGYLFIFYSIKRIGASKTHPLMKIQVVVALILSVVFLKETLTSYHLAGVIFLLFGTMLVSKEITGDNNSGRSITRSGYIDLSLPFIGGIFWGFNWYFTRLGLLEGVPILLGLSISSGGGLMLFVLFQVVSNRSLKSIKILLPNSKPFIIIGVICSFAFLLNFSALSIARVVVVNPIWHISPLFVLILSYLFLPKLEQLSVKIILGSLLIVFGTVCVIIFM